MYSSKSISSRATGNLIYVPILLLALLTLLPYYWMLISAFKPVPEIARTPPTFFIAQPTLNNFYDSAIAANQDERIPDHVPGLFQRFQDTSGGFIRYYGNSIFVTVSVTVGVLLIGSLAAFVLAKHNFPGRNFFFLLFLASMMVPWQVMLIPGYLIVNQLSWQNTFLALIVPALPKAFTVFFLRQYMLTMPNEMLDSARIDGASELRIWRKIVLPLVRPALVAMGIFIFLAEWNNFVWPLIVMQSPNNRTLPLALSLLNSTLTGSNNMGVLMAASLLVSIPTLAIFIAFQREFISGVTFIGLKG